MCHETPHALCYLGIACEFERAAPINRAAQIPEKCNAGRTAFDMGFHLFTGAWFNAPVKIFRQVCEQLAAFPGSLDRRAAGRLRFSWKASQKLPHFLPDCQPRAMQPDPHCAWLKIENSANLFSSQLFHIVQHQDEAKRSRYPQHSFVQKMMLLGMDRGLFRAVLRIEQQAAKLIIVRDQFIQ